MERGLKLPLKVINSVDFPPLLNEIPDAPKQLYVRGDLPSFSHQWLAVVGSRSYTNYGEAVVKHLIGGLSGYPVVIVSGLAYGIDALAHRAALEAGLPTVALPGSGRDWDVLYPRANLSLAKEIVEAGCALVSEFEPAVEARDYTFPQRNRIMAGMCRATLVIEAKEKSGSLITAKLAAEYNRDVLVVPGQIFSETSRGTHQFLRLGATAITSDGDLLQALDLAPREKNLTLRGDLSEEELLVIEIIANPMSRDEVLTALDMPVSEGNILLSMMEIKGLIVEELGLVRVR
ncbi:MAG TPA: DNA-processing protein DprA [Candidatus Paceibacterota bacterium]|nr:DNA-processing protein DprA [Candidatus Paceibacterota bacterium]